jgi:very-short-patch-repair endonuclease
MHERRKRVRNVSAELSLLAKRLRDSPTSAEVRLWEAIHNKKLDGVRFRFQHPVETFIFDFYCSAHKLVIEVDGSIHTNPDVHEHDMLRDEWVQAHGYHVLRIRNEDIFADLPAVLKRIQDFIQLLPEPNETDE